MKILDNAVKKKQSRMKSYRLKMVLPSSGWYNQRRFASIDNIMQLRDRDDSIFLQVQSAIFLTKTKYV